MIGKMIGAIAGQQASRYFSGIGGTQGALLGAGLAVAVRRLGPAGLIAAAAGGYLLKKHHDKRNAPPVMPEGHAVPLGA